MPPEATSNLPPLVSILIAAHNESRRIGECLDSLQAQSYPSIEIVVIDDGSQDDTATQALRKGVQVLSQSHAGKARAIAAGAQIARGEILFFLDADMTFHRDYVKHLANPILAEIAIGTTHATEHVANPVNRWSRCWQKRAGLPPGERLVVGPELFNNGSLVFRAVRAEAFRRVGGFDDVGYFDDQTLAPKLGCQALWVKEAVCSHYNVESLGEVTALGRWASVSLARTYGPRAHWRYCPPAILWRGLRELLRHGLDMAAYECAWEWGVWTGLCRRRRTS